MIIAAVGLLAAGCSDSPTDAGDREQVTRQLRARLQATVDRVRSEQRIPGAAAAVVLPGRDVWTGTSGLADVERRTPVRADTVFAIGSVTKPFVAALVLKLNQSGALSLDDHVDRWVPRVRGGEQITLQQLLNHTSGMDDYVTDGRFLTAQRRRGLDAAWTPDQLLRYTPSALAKPGERWNYSNANFLIAALAVERATRSALGLQLRRLVLPRRSHDQFVVQDIERPRGPVAVGYRHLDADATLDPTPNNPYVPSTSEATGAWGSGNLLASAEDLARAGDHLFRGRMLDDHSRREMTNWVDAIAPGGYGLGLAREKLAGEEAWGHSGDITGFHADLWHLPRSGITVAALTNQQSDETGQPRLLAERLIQAVNSRAER